MVSEVFVFLSTQEHPVLMTGGKTTMKKFQKVFKHNQECPKETLEMHVMVKGQTVKTRDVDMVSLHDPSEKKKATKHETEIEFKSGRKEVVPIKYEAFKKEFDFNDPRILYESRFIDTEGVIVRKVSIKSFKPAK